MCRSSLITLLCLAACALPIASAQLVLETDHPLALRSGEGATEFNLTNTSDASLPLRLTPGPVVDSATHAVLAKAKAELVPVLAGSDLPAALGPHETISLQATLTGVSLSSASTVAIFNENRQIGMLPVVEIDAPFNVTLQTENTADKPLAYSGHHPANLLLKNSDPQPYFMRYDFRIDSNPQDTGTLYIPANGIAVLSLKPSAKVYSIVDFVHPSPKNGVLVLSVVPPAGLAPGLLETRTLPVFLRMVRLGPTASTFWSDMYAFFLLSVGAFFSFLASSFLPNMQRRGELRAQLQLLANRTTSVSNRIDSYLRVVLRLERSRIADALERAPAWIPIADDPNSQAALAMSTLTKRLAAAERLDDLRRRHDQIAATAPPSVTDNIDVELQAAANQLHSLTLSEADLATAQGYLARVQTALDLLEDDAALAKQIAGNLSALKMRLARFPPNYYADIKQALPGIFFIAEDVRGFSNPNNIVRPMFFAIDHGCRAIQLALDYAMVRASIPSRPGAAAQIAAMPAPGAVPAAEAQTAVAPGAPMTGGDPGPAPESASGSGTAAGSSPDPGGNAPPLLVTPQDALPADPTGGTPLAATLGNPARHRLLARQSILIELLGTLSWHALRQATLLIQEMREDIYEEDILRELGRPSQAEITFDTQKTRPFLPIFFTVTLKRQKFNQAAALQRLICHWTFPDGIEEQCWNVCHYFNGSEPGSDTPPATPPVQPGAGGQAPALYSSGPPPEEDEYAQPPAAGLFRRKRTYPVRYLVIRAAVRGQKLDESAELPAPPLERTIQLQGARPWDRSSASAEFLRFIIAFTVALAGLLSGALDQLSKFDFLPATIAIIAIGFGADSIKNLLTQTPRRS